MTSALMEMDPPAQTRNPAFRPMREGEEIAAIRHSVALYFGIAEGDLNIHRRKRPLVQIRHLAMLLCCELTAATRETIGAAFDRHNSDVTHSIMAFKEMCEAGGVCGNYWSVNFFEASRRAKIALGRHVAELNPEETLNFACPGSEGPRK
jgi:hypothetical protein